MNARTRLSWPVLAAMCVVCPRVAHADTGLPMLVVVWPSAWVLFIPVCIVETLVAKRVLGLGLLQCAKVSFVANLWSTLVGIPLTWFALVLIEIAGAAGLVSIGIRPGAWILLAPLTAPWLGPEVRSWHVFAAAACLCIPFLLVSIRVERWSAGKSVPPEDARRWARIANLATYVPIVAFLIALAVSSWIHDPN